MKNIVIDCLASFWQLTTHVIFAKKAQVMFYYPQHFNRTAEGTNPFFDRLLEACDRHGISYKLIEEPDWGTDKPRNSKAIKGDALFLLIMVLRKVIGLFGKKDFFKNEKYVAGIVNILTFGRLRYNTYMTISGSMLHLFGALNSKGNVYDVQHGILFKQKATFFDEKEHLRPQYYQRNLHWIMWGRGYDQCFCRGDEEILSGRTHVVGYPIKDVVMDMNSSDDNEKSVLFSLQFTHDSQPHELKIQKDLVEESLHQLNECRVKVLLRHHPRYNNAIDINDLLEKYPFAKLTTLSMNKLLASTLLQVTFNSTTSFEYAAYGIPSFFIDKEASIPLGDIFYSEYHYPLYQGEEILDVVKRLQNSELRRQDSATVKEWYREFYDEFDENAFIKLIK